MATAGQQTVKQNGKDGQESGCFLNTGLPEQSGESGKNAGEQEKGGGSNDADMQSGYGKDMCDTASVEGFPEIIGNSGAVPQKEGLQDLLRFSGNGSIHMIGYGFPQGFDDQQWLDDLPVFQNLQLIGSGINTGVNPGKGYMAFIVKSAGIVEVSNGSDFALQADNISCTKIGYFIGDRDAELSCNIALIFSMADGFCLQGEQAPVVLGNRGCQDDSGNDFFPFVRMMNHMAGWKIGSFPWLNGEIAEKKKKKDGGCNGRAFPDDGKNDTAGREHGGTGNDNHIARPGIADQDSGNERNQKGDGRTIPCC